MPDRSNTPSDINRLAASIVAQATAEDHPQKNPHAVALGRRGGQIGGKRRKENLTAEQLSAIGKAGAAARWSKK
jgi:hypothetical protein